MKPRIRLILFEIAILLINIKVYCQVTLVNESEKIAEDKIESIAESSNNELDLNELTENLFYFTENPVNLNDTNKDNLSKLALLTDIMIYNLQNYINNYGQLRSIYELQMVNGFNDFTISKILPFVCVEQVIKDDGIRFSDMYKNGKYNLLIYNSKIIEEQKGYSKISEAELTKNPNQRYLGSPYRLYTKLRYNFKNQFQFGFTADKDAGEELFKGSQSKGFDFYSAHVYLKNNTWLRSLIIGDFQAQFGQGLTLWTGLGFSKTNDVTSVKKYQLGIKPYSSTNENGFLRGLGTTIRYKKFDFSIILSSNKVDANIGEIDTNTNEVFYVTSIQETGYHRTINELSDKNAITENICGGNILYNSKQFQLGLTAYKSNYSSPLIINSELYNRFEFNGSSNTNWGSNFNYLILPLNLFGEISFSQNQKKSYILGLQANIENRTLIGFLFRDYDMGFQNFKSNAFGENSKNSNERGIYLSFEYFLSRNLNISSYCDFFEFPWLRYRNDAPSVGSEYFIKANYKYRRNLNLYLLYREKNKTQNSNVSEKIKQPEPTKKRNIRLNLSLSPSDIITLNSRLEWCILEKGNNYNNDGFLIYQDFNYKLPNYPVKLSVRYAIFDIDSYDERIYAYENDVLYSFSFPSYYYKGSRFYLLLKFDINKNTDLWLKYSKTFYINKNVVGSGLDEINGNTKSEIKTQLIIKF